MPLQLVWPTQIGKITQHFMEHPEWYTSGGLKGHEGLDIATRTGGEIYACADGVVAEVRLDGDKFRELPTTDSTRWNYAYGNQVRITHIVPEGEYTSIYAHLLEARVVAGDRVRAGQLIGLADNTGNSTGAHLHLTLKKKGATDAGETPQPRDLIDPEPFLLAFGTVPESTGETGAPAPAAPAAPSGVDSLRYLADVTVPDNSEIAAGQAFTKTWRVTNTGTTTWGAGYTVRFAYGNPMGTNTSFPLPAAKPGDTVEISIQQVAPQAVGKLVCKWTAANGQGQSFGPSLTIVIMVEESRPKPAPIPMAATDGLRFVGDLNFAGNALVMAAQPLKKIWRVQNAGSTAWGAGYVLASIPGDPMNALPPVALPASNPGDEEEVAVEILTPFNPGTYQSKWQARNPQGQPFGDVLSLVITVTIM